MPTFAQIKPFLQFGTTLLGVGTSVYVIYRLTDKTQDHQIHGVHVNGDPIYSVRDPNKKKGDRTYTW